MINIKEPCHENWNEFSPTEQGAFCKKCQIDVVDFSVKSNNEIKSFFLEHAGQQMCGRFKQSQIDDFNIDFYNWEGQTQQTFQAKFVLTLLIVFGLTLFSCSTPKEIQNNPNLDNITLAEIDTASNQNFTSTDSTITLTDSLALNLLETPIANNNDILIGQDVITMGGFGGPNIISTKLLIDWEELTTTLGFCTLPVKEGDNQTDIDWTKALISGMMIVPEESLLQDEISSYPQNKIIPTTPDYTSKIVTDPNPYFSTLFVYSKYSEKFVINIHNSKGQLIKQVNNDPIDLGINSFNLNLTEYEKDDYYIVIASKTTHEIVKFTIS